VGKQDFFFFQKTEPGKIETKEAEKRGLKAAIIKTREGEKRKLNSAIIKTKTAEYWKLMIKKKNPPNFSFSHIQPTSPSHLTPVEPTR
jgi:hypothetical protein